MHERKIKKETNLRKILFKICDILYQIINESLRKKISKERIDRILFEKFDVFINLLRKPLNSSNEKKTVTPTRVNIQK